MSTWRRKLLWLIPLLVVFLPTIHAQAVPITHQLALGVTRIFDSQGANPIQIGNHYFGVVAVDDELLRRSGENLSATMLSFRLQIGNVVWDVLDPFPHSEFAGFRGPEDGLPLERFAPSPGFDVRDGILTGMRGGVFGGADVPFVDFNVNRFNSTIDTRSFAADFEGDLSVSWTVAPPTLLLLGVGLAAVVVVLRNQYGKK